LAEVASAEVAVVFAAQGHRAAELPGDVSFQAGRYKALLSRLLVPASAGKPANTWAPVPK
jgi:hypothetical protein